MSKADPKTLMQVDDAKCILVTFVNEKDDTGQGLIRTGYLCWLKSNDQENIADIIKDSTVVAIQWPKCDVKCAKAMKKLRNVEFEKCAVKILARGGKCHILLITNVVFSVALGKKIVYAPWERLQLG